MTSFRNLLRRTSRKLLLEFQPVGVAIIQQKWLNLQESFRSDFKVKISDSYRIFKELVQDKIYQSVACRVYDDWLNQWFTGLRSTTAQLSV